MSIVDYNSTPSQRLYIPRTYSVNIPMGVSYTPTYTIQPYLMSKDEAITPTIKVIDQLNRTLDDTLVVISKYINGQLTVVESPTTDSSGTVTWSAYPSDKYYIRLTYQGVDYPSQNTYYILKPTTSITYYIKIDLSTTVIPSLFTKVKLDWGDTLDNYATFEDAISITDANLSWNTTGGVTSYYLYLLQDNNIIDYTYVSSNIANPETINHTFNSSGLDIYRQRATIKIITVDSSGDMIYEFKKTITIGRRTNPLTFFKNAKNDMGQPMSVVVAILITAILVAILTMSGVPLEKNGVLVVGIVILGLFMWIGWFDVGKEIYGFIDYGRLAFLFFTFAVAYFTFKGGMR